MIVWMVISELTLCPDGLVVSCGASMMDDLSLGSYEIGKLQSDCGNSETIHAGCLCQFGWMKMDF